MATPKGMTRKEFAVNATDDIHLLTDDSHIWLQLRRNVPSEDGLGRSSFKSAICITPGTAQELGMELMRIGAVNQDKQKTASKQKKQ